MRHKPLIEHVQKLGQIALALGQREAAGRQRHAGHGVAAQPRPWREQLRFARYRLDLSLFFRRHIGDHEILIRRETELAVVEFRNAAHRR